MFSNQQMGSRDPLFHSMSGESADVFSQTIRHCSSVPASILGARVAKEPTLKSTIVSTVIPSFRAYSSGEEGEEGKNSNTLPLLVVPFITAHSTD